MKKDIEIRDAIGTPHIMNVNVYHNNTGLGVSMVFDKGNGGHYVLREREIKEMFHLILDEMW